MDCQWWLKWTIVNWLLMRRGIKKYRSHLDHSHFLAPQPVCLFSLSVLITCSCYFLFIWLVYEIFSVLALHPPPPLPRWDVSPLQVTPQHFIRFPWQQYPYIILGGENPVKVKCLTQEHNTATCPSLELRALDIYPSLPNISIHILPTAL